VNSQCGVVELTLDTHFWKDEGKPDGEACNVDGTLKDAKDMEWLNSLSELLPPPLLQKDESKPDGEACNADGTLKDAKDMEWLNSPSQLLPSPPPKRLLNYDSDLDSDHEDQRINKKARVSSCF